LPQLRPVVDPNREIAAQTNFQLCLAKLCFARQSHPMSIRSEAEENLRIIRSLMEKATVYRAISAPGALVGGAGAVVVSAVEIMPASPRLFPAGSSFIAPWLALLLVTTVVNFALLAREAARRRDPFVSPGMRLALRAMVPALLGGGAVILPLPVDAPELLAGFWVLFYGISLLAASHFAPKSICWLGRAFFASGMLLVAFAPSLAQRSSGLGGHETLAHMIMAVTFGLFHLVYAALTWSRRESIGQS
jgi:hypothetical protein